MFWRLKMWKNEIRYRWEEWVTYRYQLIRLRRWPHIRDNENTAGISRPIRTFDANGVQAWIPIESNAASGWVKLAVVSNGETVMTPTGLNSVTVEQHLPAPLTYAPYHKEDNPPTEQQTTIFTAGCRFFPETHHLNGKTEIEAELQSGGYVRRASWPEDRYLENTDSGLLVIWPEKKYQCQEPYTKDEWDADDWETAV